MSGLVQNIGDIHFRFHCPVPWSIFFRFNTLLFLLSLIILQSNSILLSPSSLLCALFGKHPSWPSLSICLPVSSFSTSLLSNKIVQYGTPTRMKYKRGILTFRSWRGVMIAECAQQVNALTVDASCNGRPFKKATEVSCKTKISQPPMKRESHPASPGASRHRWSFNGRYLPYGRHDYSYRPQRIACWKCQIIRCLPLNFTVQLCD